MGNRDKAGREHWDTTWENAQIPVLFSLTDASLDNTVNIKMHEFFKRLFNKDKNFSFLEIGCANSIWPSYFYKHYQAEVCGIDYSKIGCEKSLNVLKANNAKGEVVHGNLFSPPTKLLGKFDVVASFGVLEHFENTSEAIKSCSEFLKPKGRLVTFIPNLVGLNGFLQRLIDKEIYDIHLPLSKTKLAEAHSKAGLNLECAQYFMGLNLNVVHSKKDYLIYKPLPRILSGITKIMWLAERVGISIPPNVFTSPYIVVVASKI